MLVRPLQDAETVTPPEALGQFLLALFAPDDTILVRPIEAWTEGGRKKSRVVYKQVRHRRPVAGSQIRTV